MVKRILVAALMLLAVSARAQLVGGPGVVMDQGQIVSRTGYLLNESGLAYSTAPVLDAGMFKTLSAEVSYGSATFSAATFSDGAKCAGYFTVVSTVALKGTVLRIGANRFVAGTDFTIPSNESSSSTAVQMQASMTAPGITLSHNSGTSLVFATATANGGAGCQTLYSSNQSLISTSNMTGGVDPVYALNGSSFYLLSHGFTKGLPLLYTANSAAIYYSTPSVAPVQYELTDQTTYYVGAVNTNYVSLALTSAQAVAGTYMTFTSTPTQVGAHAPQLKPETLTVAAAFGTASFLWQSSNDNAHWRTAHSTWSNVATVLVTTATALSDTGTDFGFYDYRYLRLNVTAPPTGWLWLQAPVRIKQDGIGPF